MTIGKIRGYEAHYPIGLFRGPRKDNTHSRETNTFVDNNYHYKERNVKLSTFRIVRFPFMH
jgi:hypothetical protein